MLSIMKKGVYNHFYHLHPRKKSETHERRRPRHSPNRVTSQDNFATPRQTSFDFSRILQIIWFLGCLSGFTYQVSTYLSLYYKYPIRLDMKRHPDFDPVIPTISVCNHNPIKVKVACKAKGEFCTNGTITGMDDYASLLVNSTTEEILSFGYSFEDMIHCHPKSACKFFFFANGNCYSINSNYTGETRQMPKSAKKKELLSMRVMFGSSQYPNFLKDYGTQFFVHGSTNMPDSYGGFTIEPGYSYEAAIVKRIYKFLPAPYIPNCTAYDKLNITGKGYKVLSNELCLGHCIYRTTVRYFGCYYINRTEPIIESYFESKCSSPNQVFGQTEEIGDICLSECNIDCVEHDYEVELRMKVHRDSHHDIKKLNKTWFQAKLDGILDSKVKFSYKSPMVQVFEYQPVYQGIEVFGNLGGYMGMWLGASLLSFGNYVRLVWTHFLTRRRQKQEYSVQISKTNHFRW